MGSIASSGVQKLFCTIFGSRDISKLKWGIKFQNAWILDNLSVLKSDVPYCFAYIFAPFCCTEKGLNMKHSLTPYQVQRLRNGDKELSETPCCYIEVGPISKLCSHKKNQVQISKTDWDFEIWKFHKNEISPQLTSRKFT